MWKKIITSLACFSLFSMQGQEKHEDSEILREGDRVILVTKDGDSLVVPKEVREDVLQILDNQARIDSLNYEIMKEHYKQKNIVRGIEKKLTKLANTDYVKFMEAVKMVKHKIPKKSDHEKKVPAKKDKVGLDDNTINNNPRYSIIYEEEVVKGFTRKFIIENNEKVYLS